LPAAPTTKPLGNGRAVLMQKRMNIDPPLKGGYTCQWRTLKTMELPSSAYFKDYSAISINDEGRVAITSQEDAQVRSMHPLSSAWYNNKKKIKKKREKTRKNGPCSIKCWLVIAK
jgi:hypothetical protein